MKEAPHAMLNALCQLANDNAMLESAMWAVESDVDWVWNLLGEPSKDQNELLGEHDEIQFCVNKALVAGLDHLWEREHE